MKEFDGKVAIVTGASRGIGRAIALKMASEGAKVATIARNAELLKEVVNEIKSSGGEAVAIPMDVTDFNAVNDAVSEVIGHWGRVDFLINNAGITRDTLLMRMKEADWDAVISVNLKGAFNFSKAVVRQMMKQRSGVIVNISSVVGIIGNAGQTNYAASKAGLIAFTKSLAKELGPRNVRVVAVAPGFIETDMTSNLPEAIKKAYFDNIPLRRFGKPEDVAELVAFLCSDKAAYITGQTYIIDGGLT